MPGEGLATVLHADLDAFYASVEQLLDPSLRGLPIAVGGGVVLAASYEARAAGVRSGMAGWRARQLCPGLRFVGGHFSEYQRLGDRFVEVLRDFTPLVERISIDEAFLDVAGAVHLFGPPGEIARRIRARVRAELGLPVSIGAATTKHLAKVASQVAKPDGLVVVEAGEEEAFLAPLPVRLLWGVGTRTAERLAGQGIRTVGELRALPGKTLEHLLGAAHGRKLGSLAANHDARRVSAGRPSASIGAQAALGREAACREVLLPTLAQLADRVAGRARAAGVAGRTVTVRVRFADLRSVTRSGSFRFGVSSTRTLTEIALALAERALGDHAGERVISLLAVSLHQLIVEPPLQLELPMPPAGEPVPTQGPVRPGAPLGAARLAVDHAMDAVRDRFGRRSLGYAAVVLSGRSRVPDAFRELAERHPGRGREEPPSPEGGGEER